MGGFITDVYSAPFKSGADLLGFGKSGDMPQKNTAELDASTQDIIRRQQERGNLSDSDLESGALAGMDQSGAARQAEQDSAGFSSSLGGDTSVVSQALSNRASKIHDRELSAMKRTYKSNAPIRRAEIAERGRSAAMLEHKVAMENYNRIKGEEADRRAARGQMIGQILGAAGAAGGFMVAGPAGAQKGYAAGSAMGGGQEQQETEQKIAKQSSQNAPTTYESKNFGTIGGGR